MSVYEAPPAAAFNGMATSRNEPKPAATEKSLGDLFGDLARDTSRLVRQEVRLAKAEVTEKATKAGKDAALIAGGGVLAFYALGAFFTALIFGLIAMKMPAWGAALLVGVVIAVAAALLIMQGIAGLKRINPIPEQTIETLKEDQKWLRDEL